MNKWILILLLSTLFLAGCSQQAQEEICERPLMGFAFQPGVFISSEVQNYLAMYGDHADLMLIHFGDSVPWELFSQCEFVDNCKVDNPELQAAIDEYHALLKHLSLHAAHHQGKVYLSVTPLNNARSGVADNWDGEKKRGFTPPADALSDPELRTLYSKYVKYLVAKLQPDYLTQGIEINMYARENEEDFPHLLSLMKKINSELSSRVKVIGPSIQWEFFTKDYAKDPIVTMVSGWQEYGTGMALSTYPKLFNGHYHIDNYYDFDRFKLPITPETPLFISEAGISEPQQIEMLDGLYKLQHNYNLQGVVWFFLEDADAYFESLPQEYPFTIFHDAGLYDDKSGLPIGRKSADWWLNLKNSCEVK